MNHLIHVHALLGTFSLSGVSRPRLDRKSLAVWKLVTGRGGVQQVAAAAEDLLP